MFELINKYQKVNVEEFPNKVCSNPKISVCVQTYNHHSYIKNCIEGILMQKTNFEFEIIIGDDESNDGTKDICIEYAKKFPEKIRLFLHKRRNNIKIGGNPTGRFNLLYNLYNTKGKYIAICEGDDYWIDPYKLQLQIDEMENNPQCEMSFHPAKVVCEKNEKIKWNYSNHSKLYSVREVLKKPGQFAPTASYILKKSVILNLPKWFIEVPLGDFFLEVYGSLKGGLLFIPRCMSVYRKNIKGSWSERILADMSNSKMLNLYLGMEKYLQLLKEDLPYEYSIDVDKKKAAVIYGQSLYHLANSNYKLFRVKIEESYFLYKNVTIFAKFLFFFRKIGVIAKFIYINKMKYYNA